MLLNLHHSFNRSSQGTRWILLAEGRRLEKGQGISWWVGSWPFVLVLVAALTLLPLSIHSRFVLVALADFVLLIFQRWGKKEKLSAVAIKSISVRFFSRFFVLVNGPISSITSSLALATG